MVRHPGRAPPRAAPAPRRQLGEYRTSAHFTERERAALEICEQITRDDLEVADVSFARLRQHFSEAEVLEIVFAVGYQIFASKFAKAFGLAPQGFAAPASCPAGQ